jgi:hypothetical protein
MEFVNQFTNLSEQERAVFFAQIWRFVPPNQPIINNNQNNQGNLGLLNTPGDQALQNCQDDQGGGADLKYFRSFFHF